MKYISIIILFTLSSISTALSQVTEETFQETMKASKWTMECDEEICLFKRDFIHDKHGVEELITIFVAIKNDTKEIDRMVMYYPSDASLEDGALIGFLSLQQIEGEVKPKIIPEEGSMVRIPFVTCIEEGCISEVIPENSAKINYSVKDNILRNSHIIFLYTHNNKAITNMIELRSFQEQYIQRYGE